MSRMMRLVVVCFALICFGTATLAIGAEFYVVKDASGKTAVVDAKPADVKSVVKGPFKTKDEAEKAMKSAGKPKLPEEGC